MEKLNEILTEIKINRNGPIKVTGLFTITGPKGDKLENNKNNEVYLCACGRSKNKPFCDGTHNSDKTQ
jgi:CDGSH-type Zn-finger protein